MPLDQSLVQEVLVALSSREGLEESKQRVLDQLERLAEDDQKAVAEAHFLLALICELVFDREASLRHFHKSIELRFPGRLQAEKEQGRLTERLRNLDYNFPMSSTPEMAPKCKAVYLIGWYHFALKRDADFALRKLNDVISLAPGLAIAYYERAAAQFHLQEYQKAKQDSKMALNCDDSLECAKELLMGAKAMIKRADGASRLGYVPIPKADRARRAAEEERERKARIIDFSRVRVSADLESGVPIRWEGVKRVNTTDSGSSGVFFLEMEDDKIVVIKGSSFIAEEIFCSELARRLQLPVQIKIPKIVLIERLLPGADSQQGKNDWHRCKNAIQRFAEKDNAVLGNLERNLNRPFFFAMEFVYGNALGEGGRRITLDMFRQLGQVYAFDIISNNYDRFPVPKIFDHEGNSENLMVLKEDDVVIAIDTCLNPIRNADAIGTYLQEVEALARAHVTHKLTHDNIYLDRAIQFLAEFLCRELGDAEKEAFWTGIGELFGQLTLIRDLVPRVKGEVVSMMKGSDHNSIFADSCDRVDIEFIVGVIDALKRGFTS